MPETINDLQHREQVRVVLGSLFDRPSLAQATAGADLVIHAGGKVIGSSREDLWAVNVKGTSNLLRAAVQNHVRRVALLSSTAVYRPPLLPFQFPIRETSPLGPFGSPLVANYGRSKIEAERFTMALHSQYGLEYTILRPTIAYGLGPGPSAAFIEEFLQNVHLWSHSFVWQGNTAAVKMQWVHVNDLAATVVDAVTLPAGRNQIFNVAGVEAFTVRSLALIIRDILQSRPTTWMQIPLPLVYDINKAQRFLPYRPHINLRQGIAQIISDMQARGYFIPFPPLAGFRNVAARSWGQTAPGPQVYHA
jgi:nucleoside-diphosphate-sugar epimerase